MVGEPTKATKKRKLEKRTARFIKKGRLKNGTGDKDPEWFKKKDKVKDYNFVECDYAVDQASDLKTNHLVIYTHNDNYEIVKALLNSRFSMTFVDNKTGGRVTSTSATICRIPPPRGTYTQINKMRTNKYPICIVSFKRSNNECGLTHQYLTKNKIKHYLFCEPFEVDEYAEWFDDTYCEIIPGDEDYSVTKKFGSTPMRNDIMRWSKDEGHKRVWILDDNIQGYELNVQSVKNPVNGMAVFTTVEDHVDKYTNIAICSHNIAAFVRESDSNPVIVRNGKSYSSILITTQDDRITWTKKYQEDNFISMLALHYGYSNLCFNHIVYCKSTSGSCPGGNRETLYKCNGKGVIDGEGYGMSFDYLQAECKRMIKAKEIILRDGKDIDDLIARKNHNSHEFHAKINYDIICTKEGSLCKLQTLRKNNKETKHLGNLPVLLSQHTDASTKLSVENDFKFVINPDFPAKLEKAMKKIRDHKTPEVELVDDDGPVVQDEVDEVDAVGSVVQDEVEPMSYDELLLRIQTTKFTSEEKNDIIKAIVNN